MERTSIPSQLAAGFLLATTVACTEGPAEAGPFGSQSATAATESGQVATSGPTNGPTTAMSGDTQDMPTETSGIACAEGTLQCGPECVACPAEGATEFACAEMTCIATDCEQGFHLSEGSCHLWSTEAVVGTFDPDLLLQTGLQVVTDSQYAPHVRIGGSVHTRTPTGWQSEVLAESAPDCCVRRIEIDQNDDLVAALIRRPQNSYARPALAYIQTDSWNVEDASSSEANRVRLAIDSLNNANLVFGASAITWATDDGFWTQTELGDSWGSGPGNDCEMALEAMGTPVFVCIRSASGVSVYRQNGGSWSQQYLDPKPVGVVDLDVEIAIDDAGDVHLAYQVGGDLTYAVEDGATWATQSLASGMSEGVELGLSATGAHLLYSNSDGELRYIFEHEGGWREELVGQGSLRSLHTSMSLDSRGIAHIIYTQTSANDDEEHRYVTWAR